MSKPPEIPDPDVSVDWLFVCAKCQLPVDPAIDLYDLDAEGQVIHVECPAAKKGPLTCSCPTFDLFRAGHLPDCPHKSRA